MKKEIIIKKSKEFGKIMNEIMNDPKVIQESIEFDRLLKNISVDDLFVVYGW